MRKVFVTSVTGAQGHHIAQAFIRKGFQVASVTRESVSLPNIETVQGEFRDVDLLTQTMKDAEAVVLTLPLLFDSETVVPLTKQIIEATRQAGIRKIIFNSSIPLGDTKTGYAAIDVKHDALEALTESGLDIITLMPTIYLNNLASPFLLPVIRKHHIIPYPIANEMTFRWLSHENLGRYCVAALDAPKLTGTKTLITDRESISKQELAKLIGKELNTDINYVASTPDDFEGNLRPVLGDVVAREIAGLYQGAAKFSDLFSSYTNKEFLDEVELLSTEEWVRQTQW